MLFNSDTMINLMKLEAMGGFQTTNKQPKYAPVCVYKSATTPKNISSCSTPVPVPVPVPAPIAHACAPAIDREPTI